MSNLPATSKSCLYRQLLSDALVTCLNPSASLRKILDGEVSVSPEGFRGDVVELLIWQMKIHAILLAWPRSGDSGSQEPQ